MAGRYSRSTSIAGPGLVTVRPLELPEKTATELTPQGTIRQAPTLPGRDPAMRHAPLSPVLHHLRKLVGPPEPEQRSDQQLLQVFASDNDQPAFTAPVERHGPLVLSV